MEAIDHFQISLDLDDREFLYDYVERKEYRRPASGKWDLSIFKGKGTKDCIHLDNEHDHHRVTKMDQAISDKRCLEKHSKKESRFDMDELSADRSDGMFLPRRIIPFYFPGDVVKGKVSLTLNKPVQAETITVGIQGRAYVKIIVSNGKTTYPVIREEVYVREESKLWQRIDSTKADDTAGKFALLDVAAGAVAEGTILAEGDHCYQFEFLLPSHGVAQSLPEVLNSMMHKGYLMYRIKATIGTGKCVGRGNIVTHKGLWLKKMVDIAENPANFEPVVAEENLVASLKRGNVKACVSLSRGAFLIGEDIPLTVEVHNDTKGTVTKITALVKMYGKAISRACARKSINIKSAKATDGPVEAGEHTVYKMSIPWDFTENSIDGNLLPVGDMNDSALFDINYEIYVKLNRKGLQRNIELKLPIFVGNTNSMTVKEVE